jgi:hypothetical protein
MNPEVDEYLSRKVNLKELIEALDFTQEEVEHAAQNHPKLFLRVARFRVQKMRDRVKAELAYENKLSKYSSKYQEKKDEKGKRTLTEGAVKAKVQLKPEIRKLRHEMEMSFVYEKFSELLLKAYDKREFAMKVVLDARWAEGGKLVKMLKKEDGKKIAKKLAQEIRGRYNHMTGSENSDD